VQVIAMLPCVSDLSRTAFVAGLIYPPEFSLSTFADNFLLPAHTIPISLQ